MLFNKPLAKIEESDLQMLVDNIVREGREVEYKEALNIYSEEQKQELLNDVSSFANTTGGYLIYGIKESKEVNTSNDYVYRIRKAIIFGSYLSDKPKLGDVDLSIELEPRYDDPHQQSSHMQKRVNDALQKGRSFSNITATYAWPQQEIFQFLKGHSSSLSLHDEQIEQVLSKPIPSKILFDATS